MRRLFAYSVVLVPTALACASEDGSSNPGANGSGGSLQSSSGGQDAGPTGGAAQRSGGSPATGGLGSNTGGIGTGGATSTGGFGVPSGGAPGTGGFPTGGATAPSGGAGPQRTGGAPGSGGSSGTGGTPGTGGISSTGGVPSTGGAADECVVPSGSPGEVITFNDDGGWCWYQDERVIVDAEAQRMLIASVAIGGSRNGDTEVTMFDLDGGGTPQRSTLNTTLNPDDHNVPALLKLSADSYLAMYTTHNDNCYSYYNIYSGGRWGAAQTFDWTQLGCPTPNSKTVSYSNLWQMPGQIYNFVRSVETSPNLMVSPDGTGWEYGGRLTSTPRTGYVAGYYKYWGNGVDRIDFVGTEAHPRDFDNSLYHGYIQGGKSYKSDGTQVDADLADGQIPEITSFTKVFGTGDRLGSVPLTHMWNMDLMRYPDGTIVLLFQGRADGNTDNPDKRMGYARFDGNDWRSTYLVKLGNKLYDSEQDYTGLGAIHPNDPHTIYVSTPANPTTDAWSTNAKHEIWRGTTCDAGQSFTWTQLTTNSTQDNLRPVVPYWESDRTAVLWMRGTYHSAQTYDTAIVGLLLDGR